ncbi:putative holin-like toxin [Paenibacillus mesophilus]|nr:putative holin-like toxin [Paenibacillus mesophilus]
MAVKDALTLMISFGALLIALLTLVVAIVVAINQKK